MSGQDWKQVFDRLDKELGSDWQTRNSFDGVSKSTFVAEFDSLDFESLLSGTPFVEVELTGKPYEKDIVFIQCEDEMFLTNVISVDDYSSKEEFISAIVESGKKFLNDIEDETKIAGYPLFTYGHSKNKTEEPKTPEAWIAEATTSLFKHQKVSTGLYEGTPDRCSCGAYVYPVTEIEGIQEPDIVDLRNFAFAKHQASNLGELNV